VSGNAVMLAARSDGEIELPLPLLDRGNGRAISPISWARKTTVEKKREEPRKKWKADIRFVIRV